MDKKTIIIVAVIAVIALIIGIAAGYGITGAIFGSKASNLSINSAEELSALVDQIYEGVSIEIPSLMTQSIETADVDTVKYITGLDSTENVEYVVASEPMMSSQAYSLVLVKAKDGADVEAMAKSMNENIDERKWICVTAEKIYTTTSGNVICLVMSNEDTAKTVYDSFKTLAGSVGQEYERTAEEVALPEDMLMDQPAAM